MIHSAWAVGAVVLIVILAALVISWPKIKSSNAYQQRQATSKTKADAAIAARATAVAAIQAKAERLTRELECARTGTITPIENHGVVLHKGEVAYALITDASLMEVQVVGFSGKTSGYSVRIAKGLTLRQSGSRGHADRAVVASAKGRLVVTSKRVIFAGDKKSVSMPHKSITAFASLSDGLRLSDSRKTVNFLIGEGHGQDLFKIAAQRLIEEGASQ